MYGLAFVTSQNSVKGIIQHIIAPLHIIVDIVSHYLHVCLLNRESDLYSDTICVVTLFVKRTFDVHCMQLWCFLVRVVGPMYSRASYKMFYSVNFCFSVNLF